MRAGHIPAGRIAADQVPTLDEEDLEEAPGDEAEAHEDQLWIARPQRRPSRS